MGLTRGREDHLGEAIHPSGRLVVDPVGRLEVLQLAREVHRVVAVVEERDLGRPGLAGDQPPPGLVDAVPERRDHPDPGHDHPPASVVVHNRHYIPSPPSTTSTSPVMNPASSEQRNRTAPATSAGLPSRPSGVVCSIAAFASSGSTSVSLVAT